MIPQTFYVIGGNCPRSKQDLQTVYNFFVENGFHVVRKINEAKFIVVYSCGGFNFTEQASLKTTQVIREKKSKNATIVVTGCLTKINPESLTGFDDILVIDFDNIEQLDSIIGSKVSISQIPTAGVTGFIPSLFTDYRIKKIVDSLTIPNNIINIPYHLKKTFLKKIHTNEIYRIRISRGCLSNCSYCSIKLAHGSLRSKSLKEIQQDFETGLKKGYHTYDLLGEDIGCYGVDIETNIVELLKIFFNLPGKNKLIINDINPQWFIKYYEQLKPLFVENHEKIQDLRIPIQSGSNTILSLMRRQYNIEDVKNHISRLKKEIPSLKIQTHIIVGFPGETDDDFNQTLQVLKELQFNFVDVYPYSDRPMTESSKMTGKISAEVIQKRNKQIRMKFK